MKILAKAGEALSFSIGVAAAMVLKRTINIIDTKKGIIIAYSEEEANLILEFLKENGFKNAKIVVDKDEVLRLFV